MVLVSIIGEYYSSVLPVFYKYRNKISTHIIVYDNNINSDIATNIISGISKFRKKYKLDFKQINYKLDEVSIKSFKLFEQELLKHTKDLSQVYINVSDGSASLNSLISLRLVRKGLKVLIYDRFKNSVEQISNTNFNRFDTVNSIPLEDYFLLKNLDFKFSFSKDFLEKNKKDLIYIFEKGLADYRKLRKISPKEIINNESKVSKIISRLLIELDPSNVPQFINGTLFELYIGALIINYDIDDIAVGAELSYKTNKNEFDVLFVKDNHVHMIECKFTNSFDPLFLVYQYGVLQSLIDNDGKMAIFTKHNNYYRDFNKRIHNKEYHLQNRAKNNNLILRGAVFNNKKLFEKDMKEFFGLNLK